MKQNDIYFHGRGESLFVDDLDAFPGLLHAAVLASPAARGRVVALDVEAARREPGVAAVFTAADIPGENQIGGIIPDEPLLAESEVHYVGQPVAFVVAKTPRQARRALAAIRLEIEELPPVLDPRQAAAQGSLIAPPRTFVLGDVERPGPPAPASSPAASTPAARSTSTSRPRPRSPSPAKRTRCG